jgi:hypothetical protein
MSNVTHIQAFRALEAFAPEAKIIVIGNPWRAGTPGYRFYEEVLAEGPATVGECIELAGKLEEPFTEKAVQGHLRWLYTSAGGLLEVDGVRFAAPEKPVKAPKVKAEEPATPKAEEPVAVAAEQEFRAGKSKAKKRNKKAA